MARSDGLRLASDTAYPLIGRPVAATDHRRSLAGTLDRSVLSLYYTLAMPRPPIPTFADTLTRHARTDFYARHKSIAVVMILIVFFLPFAGLILWGLEGSALAVVLSALSYYLTPSIVMKLFENGRG